MLQKLEDMWPDFLRRVRGDGDGAEQDGQIEDNSGNASDDELRVDEAKLLENYKNVNWTRVIAVQGFEALQEEEDQYKWPLGPDVVEQCNIVAELPAEGDEAWNALFDPNAFNELNKPLEFEKYRLPQEDLKTWANRAINLRIRIVERSKSFIDNQEEDHDSRLKRQDQ